MYRGPEYTPRPVGFGPCGDAGLFLGKEDSSALGVGTAALERFAAHLKIEIVRGEMGKKKKKKKKLNPQIGSASQTLATRKCQR